MPDSAPILFPPEAGIPALTFSRKAGTINAVRKPLRRPVFSVWRPAERGGILVVLGIDPGYALMGWGVVESTGSRMRLINYGCIETKAGFPMQDRLRTLQLGVRDLLTIYRPDDVAFEELFFARNVTTALMVGAARGAAIIAAAEYTENLYEYTPMQIKQAVTGYGKADKKQIQQMVKLLLKMDSVPKPDDAADAIACAITHCQTGAAKSQFLMK